MAIYLDANVLWSWHSFTEAERLAVSIVGHQLGQDVVIPWIAVTEAEAELQRRITEALESIEKAHSDIERLTESDVDLLLEPYPDTDARMETWRRRLEEFATVLPLADADARLAISREIEGRRPARPRQKGKHGAGARDAAVWLSLLRDHVDRDEPGHLLSGDQKAFADGHQRLHPDLVAEIQGRGGQSVDFYADVPEFVQKLGKEGASREVDFEKLDQIAGLTVAEGLKGSLEVPRAVWSELDADTRYQTKVTASHPVEILSQRRYVEGHDAVIALNVRWELTIDALWQDRSTDNPDTWSVIDAIDVTGEIQLFLEERAGELRSAQFLGAQISSNKSIFFGRDGRLMVISGL